ncbi:MAG: hypothetical protein ACLFRY_02235 [Spirochaetia bacterium]
MDSDISLRLPVPGGSGLFEDAGTRAGLEVREEIFGYLSAEFSGSE